MSDKQVLAKLRRKAGKTTRELGISAYHARKLEAAGAIRRLPESRRTGERGRPSIQWEAVQA